MSIYQKFALKKVIFSIFILFIYVFGTSLALPGIDTRLLMHLAPSTTFALSMSGMSLDNLSLFSLGLGPWMSSLILWRIFTIIKLFHIENLSDKNSYRVKYILSLILGVIQSFTITTNLTIIGTTFKTSTFSLIFILVGGLSVLIWLANLNTLYGLGGGTLIIIAGMLSTWVHKISSAVLMQKITKPFIINSFLLIIIVLLLSYFIFRFYQGERRLPLAHVMLDNRLSKDSYLPVPTNPAGGTPFMFAFSLLLIPQYMLLGLKNMFPYQKIFEILYSQVQVDKILGAIILLLSLSVLSYGYAYVNIDYKELAKSLKKSGDYIYDVYPGKNTERYLFNKITLMATNGAIFNVLIIGIPLYIGIIYPKVGQWIYLVPTWVILIILMQEIQRQFVTIYSRNNYNVFLEK